MREAKWLTRWELRRTWRSFPATTLVWAFLGLIASTIFLDVFEGDVDFIAADIYLLAVCQALVCNMGSRDSWVSPQTAFPDRLAFFRGLPIAARDIVTSRALSRVPVLVLNSVALFVLPYVLSLAAGSGLAQRLTPVSYLWFVLMWVGYGLVLGSWVFYGELALHGRTYNLAQFIGVLPFAAIILVIEFVFSPGIVAKTIDLAQAQGPLSAAVALIAGLAVVAFWIAATSRRLARRDLLA